MTILSNMQKRPKSSSAGKEVVPVDRFRVQLRSVFYRDGSDWVSHCLEMDVMGHGKTRKQAFLMMINAVSLQITASMAHNNRANIFMPADAKFFEMFAAGKDIAEGAVVVEKVQRQIDSVELQSIEAREFAYA